MRSLLLAALLFVPAAAGAQQQQDFSKVEIKVTKVSGNIYMLEGQGGNIGASVGEDGIVIVDDEFAPLADRIQSALKNIGATDKPVRFVINTHFHGDHTGGNVPFNNAGATIIAHDNVRKRLIIGGPGGNGGSMKTQNEPQPKAALPIITFEKDVTVHLNGFPFIDVASGGSVQGMIAACDTVASTLPADVKVIPGHGALSNLDDVRAFSKMLKDTTAVVQKAIDDHKTVEQMKQEKILDPWKQFSGGFINSDIFIETLYNSLTGTKGPFVKHN